MKAASSIASVFAILFIVFLWAASQSGVAHSGFQSPGEGHRSQNAPGARNPGRLKAAALQSRSRIPSPASFRDDGDRGLIVSTWINGAGRFEFSIDTGVGITLISDRVAALANVSSEHGSAIPIGGLSGRYQATGREVLLTNLALESMDNTVPGTVKALVTHDLPPGIDGILEPADAFRPLGFTIDMRTKELAAFDPIVAPLSTMDVPTDGAVVKWIFADESRRPFVMLTNGRRVLIDTGSSLGFAVSQEVAHSTGIFSIEDSETRSVRDIGGGTIGYRRVSPATINIGSLTLRNVPTEILTGAVSDAPMILGREALRPFYMAFDPVHRLILIAPSAG
ncbi:MAG: hypothetical protein QOH96_3232 [Blastocatellia bacterium]|jgi:hypothetical protein|nr:hypothetical protein [Blastocatellia bacterium]